MKLVLNGPSGSGKTTLMEAVSKKTGLEIINVPTSEILKKYGVFSQRELISAGISNPRLVETIYQEMIQVRVDILRENENLITDRGPIESIVYYLLQHCVFNENADKFIGRMIEVIERIPVQVVNVILPVNTDFLVENGFRMTNKQFNRLYLDNLLTYMDRYVSRYVYLDDIPMSLDQRVEYIERVLYEHGNN